MSWLKRVIARLLGTPTQPLDNPVQPTLTAGLAPQEPTPARGNKRSAQGTKRQRQLSPAPQPSQKKPKAAKPTTQASKGSSKKPKPAQTVKSQTTAGSSTPTPAPRTPQRAKSAAKRKP